MFASHENKYPVFVALFLFYIRSPPPWEGGVLLPTATYLLPLDATNSYRELGDEYITPTSSTPHETILILISRDGLKNQADHADVS